MSDTWYRDPPNLPPYEDGFGKLWTFDGRCLNPDPEVRTFLDDWPEDLRWTALQASVVLGIAEQVWAADAEAVTGELWGEAGLIRFRELVAGGMPATAAAEQVDEEMLARPRPPFRGFLDLGEMEP